MGCNMAVYLFFLLLFKSFREKSEHFLTDPTNTYCQAAAALLRDSKGIFTLVNFHKMEVPFMMKNGTTDP